MEKKIKSIESCKIANEQLKQIKGGTLGGSCVFKHSTSECRSN